MGCGLQAHWELPVIVPVCIDAPIEVPIRGLVWDCGLVTHQTSKFSFGASQGRVCCLFLAAACLNSLSYLRAAAAECTENSWQMMDWYFTSSSAILGAICMDPNSDDDVPCFQPATVVTDVTHVLALLLLPAGE